MIFLMVDLIVCSQVCSIHNIECVHITRDQQKSCIKCWLNEPIKDSIIVAKDSIIEIQTVFIESSDGIIHQLDQELSKTKADLIKMKKKRNNAFIIGGISCTFGILLALLLK